MRILLVDDHGLFLEGMRNLLRAGGYQVVGAANDGLEALELPLRITAAGEAESPGFLEWVADHRLPPLTLSAPRTGG